MGARTGPASDPTRLGRRTLLRAGLTAAAAVPLLSACRTRPHYGGALRIPSPAAPIRWPLSKRYPVIDSGLKPKSGSILRVYNYADYLSPRMVKDFEAQWGVDVRISTFNDADEALTKIASESLGFDLYFPGYDSVGKLIQADLLRPLNADYLHQPRRTSGTSSPTRGGTRAPATRSPTPSTAPASAGAPTSRTSTSRRTTRRGTSSGTPQYNGNVAILDDWHSGIALILSRHGFDLNTTSAAATSPSSARSCWSSARPCGPRSRSRCTATCRPGSTASRSSGRATRSTCPTTCRRRPIRASCATGRRPTRGEIDNDLVVCLGQGDNPVAAHYFMNAILDATAAGQNFGFTGYQPPLNQFTPTELVKQGIVPQNLATAVVQQEDFRTGQPMLELPITADTEYHQIWQEFKAGG